MKKTPYLSASALALATLLASGCATNQANQQAGMGAALGCIGGAAVAALTGGKPAEGCVAGAVVGAVVGYADGRKKDLALAEQTRQAILESAKGTETKVAYSVRTEKVPEANRTKDNPAPTVESVDKMVVQVPNSLIAKKDNRAASTFGRVGGYVAATHVPATVTVATRSQQDYNYIVQSIRSGYGPSNPEPDKVKYVYTELNRGSQSSVEVAHI